VRNLVSGCRTRTALESLRTKQRRYGGTVWPLTKGTRLRSTTSGGIYANGDGVTQDAAEAVRWFRLAADQGDASAQHYLGVSYQNGDGAPQDSAEAARWIRLAADQGNEPALAAVAQLGL
jgi:TPR repeat protein